MDDTRLDLEGEKCYILVTNSQSNQSDTLPTLEHKIAHLEEVYEIAEDWLWTARARKNELTHPARFSTSELVRVPKESDVGRYDLGKITRIEATPDNYRYSISIHKTFWRKAQAEGGDEARFKIIYRFEEDLLPANAGTTESDLIPKKYRIRTESTGEKKLQTPNQPKNMDGSFMKKLEDLL